MYWNKDWNLHLVSSDSELRYSADDLKQRRGGPADRTADTWEDEESCGRDGDSKRQQWRRILLLIIAITVHNIPGMLVHCDVWFLSILYTFMYVEICGNINQVQIQL